MSNFLPAEFFEWCIHTAIGQVISKSLWGFAIAETFHIVGLTILLGAILLINLTVLGFGVKRPARRVARELFPWVLSGLLLMIGSGIPMFMSSAIVYATSFPLLVKLVLLLSAIALQAIIHNVPGMYEGSISGKASASLALICWFAVAYAGRAISFEILFGV